MFDRPIVIVGAPRSGTSLLQRLLREQPGCVSVPRESQLIWEPYIHPQVNNWSGEGTGGRRLTEEDCEAIRADYANQVVSAAVWRHWDRLQLMQRYGVAPLLRYMYRPVSRVLGAARSLLPRGPEETNVRLIEKSVHAGLWLDGVKSVFPDARFIHLTRDGSYAVDSMIDGWFQDGRFVSYRLPETITLEGEPVTEWSFPLPAGWRECEGKSIAKAAAFQWNSIQKGILDTLEPTQDNAPFLRVKLEALTTDPQTELRRVFDFAELEWNRDIAKHAKALPVVNAHPDKTRRRGTYRHPDLVESIRPLIADVQERLGYPVSSSEQ